MKLDVEEINKISREYFELKEILERENIKILECKECKEYCNECIDGLKCIVYNKTNKYKSFSNYKDLVQEGFKALVMSLDTYHPDEGDFIWWANKYISTYVGRAAKAHATIKIPKDKIKEFKPYKVEMDPSFIEEKYDLEEEFEKNERIALVRMVVSKLPSKQKKIIKMHMGLDGNNKSIERISKELKISRIYCIDLLDKAQKNVENRLRKYIR